MDFTPEIEVFVLNMLFERCHTNNRMRTLKKTKMLQFPEYHSVGPPCTFPSIGIELNRYFGHVLRKMLQIAVFFPLSQAVIKVHRLSDSVNISGFGEAVL